MNLSAWWSAWKYVAILGLLFVLSASLNIRQWSDHRAYVKNEGARLTAAAALASTKTSANLAREAQGDNRKLLAEMDDMVQRGRKTRVIYAKAAAARPLAAQCAPGQARMDAVNAGADP